MEVLSRIPNKGVVVIMAPPGTGTSVFAQQIAVDLFWQRKKNVKILSTEMRSDTYFKRVISSQCNIPYGKIGPDHEAEIFNGMKPFNDHAIQNGITFQIAEPVTVTVDEVTSLDDDVVLVDTFRSGIMTEIRDVLIQITEERMKSNADNLLILVVHATRRSERTMLNDLRYSRIDIGFYWGFYEGRNPPTGDSNIARIHFYELNPYIDVQFTPNMEVLLCN